MMTLAQQAERIRNGSLDPVAQVQEHLERIDAIEPRLQAWVIVDREGALEQAKQISAQVRNRQAEGELLGAIIGVKDIVDVAGLPTRSGASWTCSEAQVKDAPLVASLRRRGAIILGKTATTELACFDPPATRHPLSDDHTPGGSSSGSAAAVATEMCQAAVGSQTGGSITRPASFCGVGGLKPTFGALSTDGVTPVSLHLDHPGPIAQNVSDLFDCYQAMNHRRGKWLDLTAISAELCSEFRIGRIDDYFQEHASAEVWTCFERAVQECEAARLQVARAALPKSFSRLHVMHRRLMVADAAHAHHDAWRKYANQFSTGIASLIQEGEALSKDEYIEAAKHQIQFKRDMMSCFGPNDALLTPATVTTAPTRETTGDPSFNSPWSYCGLPTISIPCGKDAAGFPIGLQLIGRPHSESRLAAIAKRIETLLPAAS